MAIFGPGLQPGAVSGLVAKPQLESVWISVALEVTEDYDNATEFWVATKGHVGIWGSHCCGVCTHLGGLCYHHGCGGFRTWGVPKGHFGVHDPAAAGVWVIYMTMLAREFLEPCCPDLAQCFSGLGMTGPGPLWIWGEPTLWSGTQVSQPWRHESRRADLTTSSYFPTAIIRQDPAIFPGKRAELSWWGEVDLKAWDRGTDPTPCSSLAWGVLAEAVLESSLGEWWEGKANKLTNAPTPQAQN